MTLVLGPTVVTRPGAWGYERIEGRPFNSDISSPFGPRGAIYDAQGNLLIGPSIHTGVDLPAPGGTPIAFPCVERGRVTAEGPAINGYGNAVFIRAGLYSMVFAHMQPGAHVGLGQTVEPGGIVGQVGTTGASTGDHLHFGVLQPGLPEIRDVSQWIDRLLWLDPMHYFTPDVAVPQVPPPLTGTLPAPGTFALCVTTREVTPLEIKAYLDADPAAVERALYMLIGGEWKAYIFGAPAAVNAAFPDPVPAGAPVLVAA